MNDLTRADWWAFAWTAILVLAIYLPLVLIPERRKK